MKLVFVHGRGNGGSDAEEARLFWEGCLLGTFRRLGLQWPSCLDVVLPFYADDLDRLVAKASTPLTTDILMRGESSEGPNELQVSMLREMVDAQPGFMPLPVQPAARGPQNWPFVLAMLRALDQTPLGANAIYAITRDVWVYLTFGGIRRKIDAIVEASLPDEPCIVVAHSLGSVVAYNVLSQRGNAPLFVTLGSPMGMKAITEVLAKPLAKPQGVGTWFNARDPRDVVALHALDETHFAIDPAIENFNGVDNFTPKRHSIEGYLSDEVVARRIHAAAS